MAAPRRWAPAFAGATILALAAGAAAWLLLRSSPPDIPAPPPADVLARLARGVNISGWLQHGAAAKLPPDEADWRRIRALGFTHVRILVDPAAFVGDRGLPRADAFTPLRLRLDAALRADLLVVIALQLPSALKLPLTGNEPDRLALGGLWRALAAALRGFPPERLVLEPLNEPEAQDPAASRALLRQLVGEIRQILPRHTLVVSGHGYAGVGELIALEPLPVANLVYSFHFYEPHNFTHQGATWGDRNWKALRGFPYPSSPEIVAPLLPALKGKARELLHWHGQERWNRARVDARLDQAAQWAARHRVPLWCGEFGVLKGRVQPEHRAAWLRDVRESLEARGIAWAHWDYAGDFGVVGGDVGKRREDAAVVEALGLKTTRAHGALLHKKDG